MKNKNLFVGGKLKFKNPKANLTTLKLKDQIIKNSNSSMSNMSKNELKTFNDFKESIGEVITINNGDKKLDKLVEQIKNNEKKEEKDYRTDMEKKFDEMRMKKLPERIDQNLKGYKKELQDKFKDILDKQVNNFEMPKVGG